MKSPLLSFPGRSRVSLVVVALVVILAIPGVLPAAPIMITFQGTVNHIDAMNYSPPGIAAGDHVSFTYVVDLAAPGAFADYSYYDAFYATQVAGLRIIGSAGEEAYQGGYRYTNEGYQQTHLYVGSAKEANDWWSNVEDLPAGQYFYVGQYFYGNGGLLYPTGPTGPYAFVRYDLWVTSISAVPVPGALFLFAPGLAGLAAIRRRFGK